MAKDWKSKPEVRDESRYWMLEAQHAIDTTMCLSLQDFYFRRSSLYLAYQDHGLQFLPEISDVFKERLNLNSEEVNAQISDLEKQVEKSLSWKNRKN